MRSDCGYGSGPSIERNIERQVRRLQLGVQAGVALDLELVLLGLQMQVGLFFNQQVYSRPNIEFAFGEATALFAINPEVIYRLPVSFPVAPRGRRPGIHFVHQNFGRIDGTGSRRPQKQVDARCGDPIGEGCWGSDPFRVSLAAQSDLESSFDIGPATGRFTFCSSPNAVLTKPTCEKA